MNVIEPNEFNAHTDCGQCNRLHTNFKELLKEFLARVDDPWARQFASDLYWGAVDQKLYRKYNPDCPDYDPTL